MITTDAELAVTVPPRAIVADIDGIPISGLFAEAAEPRAVIIALHGGATDSSYFDCPGHPQLSLLRMGPQLGYTVLALDRPGYGSSRPQVESISAPQRRVDLIYAAVEQILADRQRGAGLFVWSHSVGSELATRMAADERGHDLLGIELAGTGREYQTIARQVLGVGTHADGQSVRELIWQPAQLYPPELVGGAPIASATPLYEGGVVRGWGATDFPELAAQVRIPVHFTVGDYENVWRKDPAALRDVAAMFTCGQRVVLNRQADSGHNLSLGHSAAAYHVKVLAFVEECIEQKTEVR